MRKKYLLSLVVIVSAFCFLWIAGGEAVEKAQSTPKESEVTGYLQQGLTVFLCVYDSAASSIYKIKDDIGSMVINFRGAAAAVYVGSDEKKEVAFREKLNISPSETAVFIVRSGQALTKLVGAGISKANMMKALYGGCGTGGGCGSGSGCK